MSMSMSNISVSSKVIDTPVPMTLDARSVPPTSTLATELRQAGLTEKTPSRGEIPGYMRSTISTTNKRNPPRHTPEETDTMLKLRGTRMAAQVAHPNPLKYTAPPFLEWKKTVQPVNGKPLPTDRKQQTQMVVESHNQEKRVESQGAEPKKPVKFLSRFAKNKQNSEAVTTAKKSQRKRWVLPLTASTLPADKNDVWTYKPVAQDEPLWQYTRGEHKGAIAPQTRNKPLQAKILPQVAYLKNRQTAAFFEELPLMSTPDAPAAATPKPPVSHHAIPATEVAHIAPSALSEKTQNRIKEIKALREKLNQKREALLGMKTVAQ